MKRYKMINTFFADVGQLGVATEENETGEWVKWKDVGILHAAYLDLRSQVGELTDVIHTGKFATGGIVDGKKAGSFDCK